MDQSNVLYVSFSQNLWYVFFLLNVVRWSKEITFIMVILKNPPEHLVTSLLDINWYFLL